MQSGKQVTDEITEFYDTASEHYAADYSEEHSTAGHFFQARQSIVLNILSDRDRGTVLDVGCGPGIYSEPCIALGYKYCGVDASRGMIHECVTHRRPSNEAQFFVGRMENLQFEDESFDTVMCLGALEYVEESKLRDAVANFHRVLKPKGLLILSVLNRRSPYWQWTIHVFPYLQFLYRNLRAMVTARKLVPVEHDIETKYFTRREATDLLHSMRFEVKGVRYFGFDLYPPPFDRWLFRVFRRLTPRTRAFVRNSGRLRLVKGVHRLRGTRGRAMTAPGTSPAGAGNGGTRLPKQYEQATETEV